MVRVTAKGEKGCEKSRGLSLSRGGICHRSGPPWTGEGPREKGTDCLNDRGDGSWKKNAITGDDGQGMWTRGEDEVELEAEVVVVAVSITESGIPEMDGAAAAAEEGRGGEIEEGRMDGGRCRRERREGSLPSPSFFFFAHVSSCSFYPSFLPAAEYVGVSRSSHRSRRADVSVT